jgi:hypothetical protein
VIGVLPTHERLSTDEMSGGQIEDRLIVIRQFPGTDGVLKVGEQCDA